MISKIGLRNVLRNKRRSFLSALAIGIGLASLIIADGFLIGMRESVIKIVTETYLGHAQIHSMGYRENPEPENFVKNLPEITTKLNSLQEIQAWATRIISVGMIKSPSNMQNVEIIGIDKLKESKISKIKKVIVKGKYLEHAQDILIGRRLAEKLDLKLGEKIVLTVAQVFSGELTQELFKLSGIFQFGVKEQDAGMVFILDSRLAEMLQSHNRVQEVVIKLHDLKNSESKSHPLWRKLEFQGNEFESWSDLVPSVLAVLSMSDQSVGIIATLLLFIVLLGILNTLFMSIFERMYEFGVLQALGTRKLMVFKMILSEALWLGLFSLVIGSVLSVLVSLMMNINGVSYAGIEMGEITLTGPIYVVMTLKQFIYYPLLLILFTLLAAIYPGIHATKITLAEAMKKSL